MILQRRHIRLVGPTIAAVVLSTIVACSRSDGFQKPAKNGSATQSQTPSDTAVRPGESAQPMEQLSSAPCVKISVLASGRILADGQETSLAALEDRLTRLKAEEGVVWYYREAGDKEPPPEAMEVIKLVVGLSLPITMSSKPDFSDSVDMDGRIHPRTP
jgi:hypothetical protein